MGRKPAPHFQYYYNKHNHLTYCVNTELDRFYTCTPGLSPWFWQGNCAKSAMQERMNGGIFQMIDKPDVVSHPSAEEDY